MIPDPARHDKTVELVEPVLTQHKDLPRAKSQVKKDAIQSKINASPGTNQA
jgi:hypothetical protein